MSDEPTDTAADQPEPQMEVLTVTRAVAQAVRLLQAAEMETNLALMERLDQLASSWIQIAYLCHEVTSSRDDD